MPTNLFMCYVDSIPRIRAQRLLDAAEVAGLQHMKPDAIKAWYDRTVAQARGDDVDSATAAHTPRSAFRFNGRSVSHQELKRELSGALGAGFDVAA